MSPCCGNGVGVLCEVQVFRAALLGVDASWVQVFLGDVLCRCFDVLDFERIVEERVDLRYGLLVDDGERCSFRCLVSGSCFVVYRCRDCEHDPGACDIAFLGVCGEELAVEDGGGLPRFECSVFLHREAVEDIGNELSLYNVVGGVCQSLDDLLVLVSRDGEIVDLVASVSLLHLVCCLEVFLDVVLVEIDKRLLSGDLLGEALRISDEVIVCASGDRKLRLVRNVPVFDWECR